MVGFKGSVPQLFGRIPGGMFGMEQPIQEEQMPVPMPRKGGSLAMGRLMQDPRFMMGLHMMNQGKGGAMSPIMQGLYAAQMMQQPQQQGPTVHPFMAPGLFG